MVISERANEQGNTQYLSLILVHQFDLAGLDTWHGSANDLVTLSVFQEVLDGQHQWPKRDSLHDNLWCGVECVSQK